MKSVQQLLRQPVQTIAGILLVALAVAILLTGVGQYFATALTRAQLEDNYNTIVLSSAAGSADWELNAKYYSWMDDLLERPPEMVKTISYTGLLSAYIPELTPDNYTQHYGAIGNYLDPVYGQPYSCAILVVTLESVEENIKEESISGMGSDGVMAQIVKYATMTVKGRVDHVISLQDGFTSPDGFSIELTVKASDAATLQAMSLTIGEQYLVYGMDYFDNDWLFRRELASGEVSFYQPFDNSKLYERHPLGEEHEVSDNLGTKYYYYENADGTYTAISERVLSLRNTCRMTACDYATLPDVVFKMDENNNILGFELLDDQRVLLEDENSNTMLQRGTSLMSADKYLALYSIPSITKLSGNAQQLLDTEEWRKVLEMVTINYHAFPVLAVDKLGYQAEFARQQARIVSGRDFTKAELTDGAKVCILSETLAASNGIAVGDTITLQYYGYDPNLNEDVLTYPKTTYPDAYFYSGIKALETQETYTVVGLYRTTGVTAVHSSYGFTSNTVFIPKNSINMKMVMGTEGVFRTIVLQNGTLEEFKALTKEAGIDRLFAFYDQGYLQVASELDAYEQIANKASIVGAVAYLIILMLFLILFPGRQRRELRTMVDLGTPRCICYKHIIVSSAGYLLPGTVIGVAVSFLLSEKVTSKLMAFAQITMHLEATEANFILLVALCQFLLAFVLTAMCAWWLILYAMKKYQ